MIGCVSVLSCLGCGVWFCLIGFVIVVVLMMFCRLLWGLCVSLLDFFLFWLICRLLMLLLVFRCWSG